MLGVLITELVMHLFPEVILITVSSGTCYYLGRQSVLNRRPEPKARVNARYGRDSRRPDPRAFRGGTWPRGPGWPTARGPVIETDIHSPYPPVTWECSHCHALYARPVSAAPGDTVCDSCKRGPESEPGARSGHPAAVAASEPGQAVSIDPEPDSIRSKILRNPLSGARKLFAGEDDES
jgi:hypothetical protein